MDVHLRWLERRDMRQVLDLEQLCFPHPWDEAILMAEIRKRNVIAMVVTDDADSSHVVGFMVYVLEKSRLEIANMSVLPSMQRCGIGRTMIDKLKSKLSHDRRCSLYADVWEANLDGQLFFRAMGFRAVKVIEDHYEEISDQAGYRFAYHLTSKCPVVSIPQAEPTA